MPPIEEVPYQILATDGTVKNLEFLQSLNLTREDILKIYWCSILIRTLGVELERRAYRNDITIAITPIGSDVIEAVTGYFLPPEVKSYAYGRNWGHAIGRGVHPKSVVDGFSGNPCLESIEDFKSHSVEIFYVAVSAQLLPAVGEALVAKVMDKKIKPTIAYFGDGATAEGFFHCAMNWASVYHLPVIFLCVNNLRAISTLPHLQTPTETFAERARGYNMAALRVDGNDPFAVCGAIKSALRYVYEKSKPVLIETVTELLTTHTTAVSREQKLITERKRAAIPFDPLPRFQRFVDSPAAEKLYGTILDKGADGRLKNTIADLTEILEDGTEVKPDPSIIFSRTNVDPDLIDSYLYAEAYKLVKDSTRKSLEEFLEAKKSGRALVARSALRHRVSRVGKRYKDLSGFSLKPAQNVGAREAIALAFYDALRFDPDLIIWGEDVAEIGDVNCTTALHEKHAEEERWINDRFPEWREYVLHGYFPFAKLFPDRVLDTPLDEAGIVGVGIGAARAGKRPVMCLQFAGFMRFALHFFEEYSRMSSLYGGSITMPGVFFLPFGGGERIPWHRNEREPWLLLGDPGTTLVCPSIPQDFYDLMWAAIASDDPVAFLAHLDLYRQPRIEKLVRRPPSRPIKEFGIRTVQSGNDITLISYGRLVYECVKAADLVASERSGFTATVLDARVLNPLDFETIAKAVKDTRRLLVVQEEPVNQENMPAGVGAVIISAVATHRELFGRYLDAPIGWVGAPPAHFPAPPKLWDCYIPQPDDIAKKIKEIVDF